MKTKVVVTGCAGFIGSHLTDHLLKRGFEVIGIDNFITGNMNNIVHLSDNYNFRLYNVDLKNYLEVYKIFKTHKDIDCVFHQAALGSIPRSFKSPRDTFRNNVDAFDIVLNACVDFNIKKIIFASSSSVYGGTEYDVKTEGREEKIMNPYAMSKYLNEKQAESFGSIYNIKWYGLRYFNVFGPRQDYKSQFAPVISKWANLMKQNKDVEITGSFQTERDFTYIDNVLVANMLCYYAKDTFSNTCYNIGCGESTTLEKLFHDLKILLRSDSLIKKGLLRQNEKKKSVASLKKSKNLIGYEPVTTYKEGLRKLCTLISSETERSAIH